MKGKTLMTHMFTDDPLFWFYAMDCENEFYPYSDRLKLAKIEYSNRKGTIEQIADKYKVTEEDIICDC